ncbi:MAG: hypothetical protein LRY76_09165 [Alphaproteobacteria bacterium]|nr:hypothetical protein [Alphaproteobacteria bacterium]
MRFRSGILYVSVLALGTVLTPLSVQAGFEWVAPKEDMSAGMELPVPKPGTPRIAPDPMGLDPLPPLSVDQESGTRATVYAPAPAAPAAAPTASIPRRAMPPAVSEMAPREMEAAPRMRTLQMGAGQNQNNRMAGSVSVPVYDDPNQPKRLRMSEQLVVPPDVEIEAKPPKVRQRPKGRRQQLTRRLWQPRPRIINRSHALP